MRPMCSSRATFLPFFFHLALAAPHISPREEGCGVGVTGLPSTTYTMMAPVQTIIIDMAQEDGCPWIKAEVAPTLALPAASPSASNSESSTGPNFGPNPAPNPAPNDPANVPQPSTGPAATGSIDGGDGFSQNIPTGNANNENSATQTQGASPTTLVGSPTESPPPRFVIYAGSTQRAFQLPYLDHSPLIIGVLVLWSFVILDM